ncbi:MAG: ABC transporter substrate-binding protein, partial [Propionibacteriaceae bacterium]|nr:ABC transporter substrate-binding protein [Propionibacteriaceae bacterium]
ASTLAAAGLSLDDINVVDMNVDQGLSAFLGGNGDFYLGGTPQRVKAVKEGNRVLVDATNLPASAIELAGFAATDQFIANHSDALLKFIDIWYRGINYVKENPDDGYQRIVDKVNEIHGTEFLTVDDLAGIWNKVEYFPESACAAQGFFFEEDGARYWRQSFEAINTVYLANGSIKQAVLPEEVLAIEEFQQKALEVAPC